MTTSRRDLLKFFGIGTVIAPVVGGVLRVETPAQLVAIPDVAPVEAVQTFSNPAELFSKAGRGAILDVYITTGDKTYHLKADTFLTRASAEVLDVTNHASLYRELVRSGIGSMSVDWRLEGTCRGDELKEGGAPISWRESYCTKDTKA